MKHDSTLRPLLARLIALGVLLAPGCGDASLAEQPGPPASDELEPVSATVFGRKLLVFLEHPPLVRGESARFLVHATVLGTGEPVVAGRAEVTIGGTALSVDGPKRDGLFVPEGSVPAEGTHPAKVRIVAGDIDETLDLGERVVHESADRARRAAEAPAQAEPAGAVPFLMEQQWTIRLLVVPSTSATLSRRLVIPGQVRAPEGAEAIVAAPLAGRFLAADPARAPRTGDAVEKGSVLGAVEPPLGAADLAQLEALRLELELEALDIARALGEARARLEYASSEHGRVSKLREHGLSTAQELDEAERNLALAKSESEGASAAAEALERLRSGTERPRGSEAPGTRFPLVAPLGGVVVSAGTLHGQAVAANEELLRILDPSRVWIEGRISEFDLPRLGPGLSAAVTFAALPDLRLEVAPSGESPAWKLLPIVDERSRTALLRCEVDSRDGALKPGMLAGIELVTERVDAAVVVPQEAVVIDNGAPTAYVMLEGELFQRRELQLGIRDGGQVEILRGIEPGERVATRGAYAVKLASLAPASFGHGHEH